MKVKEEINQKLGFRIMTARERAGLTALQLAAAAGVHRNTVSRVESGISASLSAVVKITRTLGISIDSLIEDRKPTREIQLELWPKKTRRKYAGSSFLPSDSRGRSDVLYTMQSGVGSFGPGTTKMPATSETSSDSHQRISAA